MVLYINGIELKRSCVSIGEGIRQNLTNQKKSIFRTTLALLSFSCCNEAEGLKYGTIETPEKYYLNWKEDIKASDELSASIKGIQSRA